MMDSYNLTHVILPRLSHNSFNMAVVYVPMCDTCKICFTVYTGEQSKRYLRTG